jgi:uncharacterized protein (TIGR00251 family)
VPVEAGPGGEVRIHLKVVPNAAREGVAGRLGARLKVRVAAPPEDGRANAAVLALLAERLGLPRRALRVVAGARASAKTVAVRGTRVEDVRALLLGT